MKRILIGLVTLLFLVACKDEESSRIVVQSETPDGRAFHFMPIYEDGVTDITITIAWPNSWTYEDGKNPAAPYVAAESILSGGTDTLKPQNVLELFNDKNSSGRLFVRSNHAVGEVSFPKEHIDDVLSVVTEMLTKPQLDPAWINRIKQGYTAN